MFCFYIIFCSKRKQRHLLFQTRSVWHTITIFPTCLLLYQGITLGLVKSLTKPTLIQPDVNHIALKIRQMLPNHIIHSLITQKDRFVRSIQLWRRPRSGRNNYVLYGQYSLHALCRILYFLNPTFRTIQLSLKYLTHTIINMVKLNYTSNLLKDFPGSMSRYPRFLICFTSKQIKYIVKFNTPK